MSEYLNQPKFCPHGGVIPGDDQPVHEEQRETLVDYPVGTTIRIARVLDEKELLDYLVSIDLNIHEEYTIDEIAAYEGPISISNKNKKIAISYKAASTIFVDQL